MSSLYELTNEYRYLMTLFEDPETEEEVLLTTLDSVKAEIEVKAEGYIKVMRMLEAEQKALETEAKFYSDKASTIKNNISRMKKALCEALIDTGHDTKEGLKAGNFTLKVAGNGGVQPMEITGEVPDNYQKIIYEADKDKIRKALENGEELSFAELLPRGKHLSIK